MKRQKLGKFKVTSEFKVTVKNLNILLSMDSGATADFPFAVWPACHKINAVYLTHIM